MAENFTQASLHLVANDSRTDTTGNNDSPLCFRELAGHDSHTE